MERKIKSVADKYQLTPGEYRIFYHMAFGRTAKEIARKENLGYETVRWHFKQIYQKLGIKRQAELIRLFFDEIDPEN